MADLRAHNLDIIAFSVDISVDIPPLLEHYKMIAQQRKKKFDQANFSTADIRKVLLTAKKIRLRIMRPTWTKCMGDQG